MQPASTSTWWPAASHWRVLIVALLCATAYFFVEHALPVSRYLAAPEEDNLQLDELVESGNAYRRVAFALLGVAGIAGWFAPTAREPRGFGPQSALLLAYFAWCFASVAWSDDPAFTLRRLGVLAFSFLAILGLGKQLSPRELCWVVVCVAVLHLGIGITAELQGGCFLPFTADYRFAGTIHPNNQGVQLAALCLAALCLATESRRERAALFGLAAVAALFLFLTRSRTSCAAVCMAAAFVWLPRAPRSWKIGLLIFAPFLLSLALLVFVFVDADVGENLSALLLLGRQEEAGTLTGRIPLWIELSKYVQARPITGYGYGSFWTVARMRQIADSQGWQIAHAHSAYLETVLNVGLVGAGLLLAALVQGVRSAWSGLRRTGDVGLHFFLAFLVFAATYSLTDAVFATPSFPTLALLIGLASLAFTGDASDRVAAVQPVPLRSPGGVWSRSP